MGRIISELRKQPLLIPLRILWIVYLDSRHSTGGFIYRKDWTLWHRLRPEVTIWSNLLNTTKGDKVYVERQLGDSELSYFLPSRGTGVNDMYLRVGFHAPEHFVERPRVRAVWAILRARHPLLASKVIMRGYDEISFGYTCRGPRAELADADTNLDYRSTTGDDFIDLYLNGPRILSEDHTSYLVILKSHTSEPQSFEVVMCATHFIGDGLALHQMGNDFFSLLGSTKTVAQLEEDLAHEWRLRCVKQAVVLPDALETILPPENKFCQAANQLAFQRHKEKQIGGHAFPRRVAATRRTVTRLASFESTRTKAILKSCKSHGVSVSAAVFAVCNIAWARVTPDKKHLPILMYSALNMRPYIPILHDSWMLALGYFNVILPSFIPKSPDVTSTFWARARSAKSQSANAARSPLIVARNRRTAYDRARSATAWAMEDDEKERGTWKAPPLPTTTQQIPSTSAKAPSTALIGLSLMGNLDGIYQHAKYPDIVLHTQTGGTRQRPGGMLIFSYTFAGKLYLTYQYDENGFDRDVVEHFWTKCLGAIKEFL